MVLLRPSRIHLLGALSLAGCEWLDPNDCRAVGEEHCEVYRPQGLVCGLAHAGLPGHPGSSCLGYDPAYAGWELQDASCPEGFQVTQIGDEGSEDAWVFCAAEGNAERSSADLDEVPTSAACGLNTLMGRATENLCMGADPTRAECPEGFGFRYGLEVVSLSAAHLVVWCELVDRGCEWGDCQDAPDPLCGFGGSLVNSGANPDWVDRVLNWEELSPELQAHVEADIAQAGSASAGGVCQGYEQLELGSCGDELERVCVPDQIADGEESGDAESFCWCAAPGTVQWLEEEEGL